MDTKTKLSHTDEFLKVKESLEKELQGPCSSPGQIQFLASTLCHSILTTDDKAQLSAQDRQRLVNQATAMYLSCWLNNDKELTQTIYSFVSRRFVPRSKQKRRYKDTTDQTTAKMYQRKEFVFREMMSLREEQARKESTGTKSLPKKNNSRCYYSFDIIYFIYMMAEKDWLRFYDLLTGKKNILAVTSEKGSNESLFYACKYYMDFLDHIGTSLSRMEYVIANIVAYNIETTYRFSLAIKIAQYIGENSANQVDFVTHPFWSRYMEPIFAAGQEIPIEAMDILNYDSLIPSACRFNIIDTEKVVTQRLWRKTLTTVFRILVALNPPDKQPSWKDEDFSLAEEFFRKEFNVIEAIMPAPLKKDDSNFLNNVRILYAQLDKKDMPLFELRKSIQESRKKRNQRKPKAGG